MTVEAQFNPKEISIDKSVPWAEAEDERPPSFRVHGRQAEDAIQNEIDKLHLMSDVDSSLKRTPKVKGRARIAFTKGR